MKITCITIDDEPLALEKINSFVQKIPFLQLNASFSNGIDAMNYLKDSPVDLMFLDIQMDDLNGIQLLEILKEKPKVIITTAYDCFAIKGYELAVSDYLLKPFSFERFVLAVNKIHDSIKGPKTHENEQLPVSSSSKDNFAFIKTEYRMQKVNFDDILYVEGMKDYLRIVTTKERIMTLQNFKNLMAILPDDRFIRVHKSYVVAVSKIESIERNRIKIADQLIPIGDNYKQSFMEFLEKRKLINP